MRYAKRAGRAQYILLDWVLYYNRQACSLGEDGLGLAAGAEVALEALAEAGGVIAETTAGAIAAEVVALAEEDVIAGGAFFEGAVGATGAEVANATDVLEGIPGLGVGLGGLVGELFLLDAAATAVAVGGAYGTLAGLAVVAIEALAFTGLAVAHALHGAFDLGVGAIVSGGVVNPGSGLGAGTDGAIVSGPGGVSVLGTGVASALVVAAAGAVATAAVGAVRRNGDEGDEGDKYLEHGVYAVESCDNADIVGIEPP
jgi:hypothetical protein